MLLHLHRPKLRKILVFLFTITFAACLWIGNISTSLRPAQARDASTFVEAGVQEYQAGDFLAAIAQWQQALTQIESSNLEHRSIVFENLARAQRQVGAFSEAVTNWDQAAQLYQHQGNQQALGRARTEQAQVYGQLGQHRRAIALLCGKDSENCAGDSALQLARNLNDQAGEAAALGSLGESYRVTGNYPQAQQLLEQSLGLIETAEELSPYQAAVLNSLGNTYGAQANASTRRAQAAAERGDLDDEARLAEAAVAQRQRAIELLQRSSTIAERETALPEQMQAQLNLIPLYQDSNQATLVNQAWKRANRLVNQLPDNQEKAFALITLAKYLEPSSSSQQCPNISIQTQEKRLFNQAITISQGLDNPRAESFALGQFGYLYERCGDYEQALDLTQSARLAADQAIDSQDSLYLWAWQQGRILKALNQTEAASNAYDQALSLLEAIRSDIVNANPELQFDFRDQVEPIYREFATLKLDELPVAVPIEGNRRADLDSVLVTLDSLKLAELQNYFASDCVIVPSATRVDVMGTQTSTAVISTAILPDRTAVIASFPDGRRQVAWIDQDQDSIRQIVNDFRRGLETFFREFDPQLAQQLYSWLIQPFATELEASGVDTLVFVNDGILRSIPMAALHDGQQFLVERFAIATTPSLQLTDPQALNPEGLRTLALGLSDEVTIDDIRFNALPFVEEEVNAVSQQLKGTQALLNQAFSRDRLQKELAEEKYSIIHVATHGQFGAEPDSNFIVTGDGEKLTISELDGLLRQLAPSGEPIELLALTACETAIGDERATLGLAGVAIRAGARSAIASLWSINDSVTSQLVEQFYRGLLDPELNKAEALQAAQISQIQKGGDFAHPARWAPLVMIGNWL